MLFCSGKTGRKHGALVEISVSRLKLLFKQAENMELYAKTTFFMIFCNAKTGLKREALIKNRRPTVNGTPLFKYGPGNDWQIPKSDHFTRQDHFPPPGTRRRLTRWRYGGLDGWLVGWLDGWLAGWVAGWLASWSVGWLAGWLAGGLVGWWVAGCLVAWLAGMLVVG